MKTESYCASFKLAVKTSQTCVDIPAAVTKKTDSCVYIEGAVFNADHI